MATNARNGGGFALRDLEVADRCPGTGQEQLHRLRAQEPSIAAEDVDASASASGIDSGATRQMVSPPIRSASRVVGFGSMWPVLQDLIGAQSVLVTGKSCRLPVEPPDRPTVRRLGVGSYRCTVEIMSIKFAAVPRELASAKGLMLGPEALASGVLTSTGPRHPQASTRPAVCAYGDVGFDLRRLDTGVLVHQYATEGAALAFLRDVVRIGGREQAAIFALDEHNEDGTVQTIARGADLVLRALQDRAL